MNKLIRKSLSVGGTVVKKDDEILIQGDTPIEIQDLIYKYCGVMAELGKC